MSFKADIRVFARGAESNPELARESLWRILAVLDQAQKSVKRDAILVIILAAAFEMLNRKLIGEASALGIKAAKLEFLKYILPVAMGYVSFRAALFVRERKLMTAVYYELTSSAFPVLRNSRIDVVIHPSSSLHVNSPPESWLTPRTKSVTTFLDLAEGAMVRAIIPVGFTIYAALQLFRSGNPPYVGAMITTFLAAAFIVSGYLCFNFSDIDMTDLKDDAKTAAPRSDAAGTHG